jgi:hypothetical protein
MIVLTMSGALQKATPAECGGDRQHSKRQKGEMMKKYYVRILSAFFGLAALAISAKGQAVDQLVVNVPYEFVVAGKTLPAGPYRVNRINDTDERQLMISSLENREAVMVISNEVTPIHTESPSLSFQHAGGEFFLSKIATAEHVFTIPVSKRAVSEAIAKTHGDPSAASSGK